MIQFKFWSLFSVRLARWTVGVVLELLMLVIAVLFVNWWAPFVAVPVKDYLKSQGFDPRAQQLPDWLKWFDTFDNSLDVSWLHGYFDRDYHSFDAPPPFWSRKWMQIRWLYRNPDYGFSYWAQGIQFAATEWKFKYLTFKNGHTLFLAWSVKGYFTLMYDGWVTSKLGWKTWGYWDPERKDWRINWQWGPESRAPLGFTPFMGRDFRKLIQLLKG